MITVAARGISSGKVRYTLSGWLGGFDGQGDHTVLTITFQNGKGKAIGTGHIGPVTEAQRKGASEMLFRTHSGAVPAATRSIKVKLVMTRTDGSDNDGLADNLSLVLKLK